MPQDIIIAGDKAQPMGRYPHTRRVGPWIFISGTSSRRPDNTFAGAELIDDQWQLDIKVQTQAVMENIQHYLQLNGCDMEHLIDVTVFLKNMADFNTYNDVYNSFFISAGPCRTTVAVADLPRPQILIEIKATAFKE